MSVTLRTISHIFVNTKGMGHIDVVLITFVLFRIVVGLIYRCETLCPTSFINSPTLTLTLTQWFTNWVRAKPPLSCFCTCTKNIIKINLYV